MGHVLPAKQAGSHASGWLSCGVRPAWWRAWLITTHGGFDSCLVASVDVREMQCGDQSNEKL